MGVQIRALVAVGALTAALQPVATNAAAPTPDGDLLCFGRAPTMIGTDGKDELIGGPGTDVIVGLNGKDYIDGGGGRDFLCGGGGADEIRGGLGGDKIHGQGGDDILIGGAGRDRLKGGSGDDGVVGGKKDDVANGGGGSDHCDAEIEKKCENGRDIVEVERVGDPVYIPGMGDLWMSTWADDDRVYLTWGDGTGAENGYPVGHPRYLDPSPISVPECGEFDLFCQLWCNLQDCTTGESWHTSALVDAGIAAAGGPIPDLTEFFNVLIDVPDGEPFFLNEDLSEIGMQNDKPSSILYMGGKLYLAGHRTAAMPQYSYIAYSEDYGATWTEVPDSPWTGDSNFMILMWINMGQSYSLNTDGYVYAFGIGEEAEWLDRTVYLTRVPRASIAGYSSYEYFTGLVDGAAGWSSEEDDAVPVDTLATALQASAIYHEGTDRYLFLTADGRFPDDLQGLGALYQAEQPWGPWTEVDRICFDFGCGSKGDPWTDGKYIPGLMTKGADFDTVYFTISGGDDHYQLQIGRLDLITAE